ncbi:MAG TPA: hypothetical protein VK980_14805 [Sphingomonas sp.]|nr:hypothetical protein [Sphingomonas sp.]
MRVPALCCAIAGLLMLWAGVAGADSWAPARRQVIYSADHHVRLTIDPRAVADNLRYFEDKVRGREPAGQQAGAPDKAQGWLEREDAAGHWSTVWRKALVNDVSPVSALVANDGAHVVTFDNWHAMGFGDDAVVIYGPDGAVVRAMALTAFLPEDYVAALPRSVSSLHWSGEHHLSPDGSRVVLEVVVPRPDEEPGATPGYTPVEVSLADGHAIPPAGAGWDAALASARVTRTRQLAAEEADRQAMIAPLLGPKTRDEADWHQYLQEAYFRLDPHWSEEYPGTTVLRDRAAADYAVSAKWVVDAITEREMTATVLAFASPSSIDNLVRVLGEAARKVRPGKLHNARIYVAVGDADRDRVAAALAPTGARFIQLDPARPIPQRPERVPGSPEQAAAQAAEEKRMTDEIEATAPLTDPPPRHRAHGEK